MKFQIHDLQDQRAKVSDSLKSLIEGAEGRDLTTTEQASYSEFKKSMSSIDSQIQRATDLMAIEIIEAKSKGQTLGKTDKKDLSKYSFVSALRMASTGKYEGLEGEMHNEAVREARARGNDISGLGIPSMLIKVDRRDMTAGTTTAGGYTIPTDLGDTIPFLRPRLKVIELGATVLSGLTGNLDIPQNDSVGAAAWAAENGAASEINPTFANIQLRPKRLAATIDVSKRLLGQSSLDVEAMLRNLLSTNVSVALDAAAIQGSGSSNQPTGILNTSGILSVVGGTNGANPTWANVVSLESAIASADADLGSLAYLTTPGIRGYMKATERTSGNGRYIWDTANELNGYRAEASTQVPSTLTKGSSSICHAIIFGNWSELIVAQWGGMDITVDMVTKATTNLMVITVGSDWDIAVKHAASFAAMKDALV